MSELKFTKWSLERIAAGKKFATCRRTEHTGDKRVFAITAMPLRIVRDFLYAVEGAKSPAEYEKVWRSIHRGHFNPEQIVYVHFGDFRRNMLSEIMKDE